MSGLRPWVVVFLLAWSWCAVLWFWLVGVDWWRHRRLVRAQDQAIALTRHPSHVVPVEDRPDWPPAA